MKTMASVAMVCGFWLATSSAAWAGVTVNFVKPDEFEDVPRSTVDRDRVLVDIKKHWAKLAERLPAGQDLTIDVLDLDLAGRLEPSRGTIDDLRILRGGADWPKMYLRYSVAANGQVLASGEARLSNMMYLDRMNTYDRSDPLRYEKQMMDDWFGRQFGLTKASKK